MSSQCAQWNVYFDEIVPHFAGILTHAPVIDVLMDDAGKPHMILPLQALVSELQTGHLS